MFKISGSKTHLKDVILSLLLALLAIYFGAHYFKIASPIFQDGYSYQSSTASSVSTDSLRYGITLGATILSTYCIFRTAAQPFFSFGLSLLILFSSFHLYHLLPSLNRDYIKAPFSLTCIWLLICAISEKTNKLRFLTISFILAITIALGCSFRSDLLIFNFAYLIILVCFTSSNIKPKSKLTSFAVFFITFAVSYNYFTAPALSKMGLYWVNMGFAEPFNSNLGISSKNYTLEHVYQDNYNGVLAKAENTLTNPEEKFHLDNSEVSARFQN